MAAAEGELWTGPQLAAYLASLGGVAPEPACYVVFRATLRTDGAEQQVFEIPEEAHPLQPEDWPKWLRRAGFTGPDQLRVAVLVIRESLEAGHMKDCSLERRRGAIDGPFVGHPARVEFLGPARAVRHRAMRNGKLQEIAPSPGLGSGNGGDIATFIGEQEALERYFGTAVEILDTREPTLFEDLIGLSSVQHVRLPEGTDMACGVGWHGTTPYVLVADFPRLGVVPELPPPDEAAVQEALQRHDLVRHETRLDEHGLAVLARQRGGVAVFLLRSTGGRISVESYQPAPPSVLNDEQRKWLRYAEMHETLTPLDGYREDDLGAVIVLTGDQAGHAWRHCVDADGVELWRRAADDVAAAALHRERLLPGTLARTDAPDPARALHVTEAPEESPPAESLLALGQAVAGVLAVLGEMRGADPLSLQPLLRTALAGCDRLAAAHSANRIVALLAELQAGSIAGSALERRVAQLPDSIRQELALLQALILHPAEVRLLNDVAPFGEAVAQRFPGCGEDIAEAARCLALRRPTAAVFHCMRVAEHGLRVIAAQAHVTLPASLSWPEIPSLLRSACPPSLAAALHGLARCWRAPGLAPAAKYTEAEAMVLFQALGVFMRELSAEYNAPPASPRSGRRKA